MSNEISVGISLRVSNIKYADNFQPGNLTFDQNTLGGHAPVVTVTTGEEIVDFGDIGTKGWIAGRNLDSANYVIMGPASNSTGAMHPFIRVEAGEPFCFRFEPTVSVVKWHSNTGTVKMQIHMQED